MKEKTDTSGGPEMVIDRNEQNWEVRWEATREWAIAIRTVLNHCIMQYLNLCSLLIIPVIPAIVLLHSRKTETNGQIP